MAKAQQHEAKFGGKISLTFHIYPVFTSDCSAKLCTGHFSVLNSRSSKMSPPGKLIYPCSKWCYDVITSVCLFLHTPDNQCCELMPEKEECNKQSVIKHISILTLRTWIMDGKRNPCSFCKMIIIWSIIIRNISTKVDSRESGAQQTKRHSTVQRDKEPVWWGILDRGSAEECLSGKTIWFHLWVVFWHLLDSCLLQGDYGETALLVSNRLWFPWRKAHFIVHISTEAALTSLWENKSYRVTLWWWWILTDLQFVVWAQMTVISLYMKKGNGNELL